MPSTCLAERGPFLPVEGFVEGLTGFDFREQNRPVSLRMKSEVHGKRGFLCSGAGALWDVDTVVEPIQVPLREEAEELTSGPSR